MPVSGVFAVTMRGIDEREIKGIANVGVRPTVDDSNKVVLETFLFDFDRDIYGHKVTVDFMQKIRAERRFQAVDELKAQIVGDVAEAKKFFATHTIENNGL
jgi:riboflavin kinase/FMN adenylyltransferase